MISVNRVRACAALIGLALLAGLLGGCAGPPPAEGADRSGRETTEPLPNGALELAVLSGSMEPAIPAGSLIAVVPVDPAEVRIGDIITFMLSSTNVTHRVADILYDTERDAYEFVTKGDTNNVNDPAPVPAANIVGKFLRITMDLNDIDDLDAFIRDRQGGP